MKRLSWKTLSIATLAIAGGAYLASCGGSSGSSISLSTSAGYTSDAAFGSPFATSAGSSIIIGGRPFASTLSERRTEIQALLNASAVTSCTFDTSLAVGTGQAPCYSPNVDLANGAGDSHPDTRGTTTPANEQLLFGDGGIWDSVDEDSSDACAAAQINELTDYHAGQSHFANLMGAALECFVDNTSDLSKPSSIGGTTTLSSDQLTDFVTALETGTADSFTVTSAVVTGIQDSAGDFSGYRYEIGGTWTDGAKTWTFVIKTQHLVDGDGALKGSLAYSLTDPDDTPSGDCTEDGLTYAGDLIYDKTSSTDMSMVINSANFCGSDSPLRGASNNYTIDPCDMALIDSASGWTSNWNHVRMDFNPNNFAGDYVFVWQAGNGDRKGRTFNATLSVDGDTNTATAYYGYGDPIQDAPNATCSSYSEDLGAIEGFICNWSGPGNVADGSEVQELVQRQVVTLDTSDSNANWVVSSEKIRYAPVTACEYDAADADFDTFSYLTNGKDYDNDSDQVGGGNIGTHDLLDFSSYSFTVPTAPTLSVSTGS